MSKINRLKKAIAISLLIANLTVFNSFVPAAFAQGESIDSGQSEEVIAETPGETIDVNTGQDVQGGDGAESGIANGDAGLSDEAAIATGDVNINIESENEVNTNQVISDENNESGASVSGIEEVSQENVPAEVDSALEDSNLSLSPSPEASAETAADETDGATEDEIVSEAAPNSGTSAPEEADVQIANNNEGDIGNSATAEGDSGNNTANSAEGDASIDTGNANVVMGLVNTANTNITESNLSQLIYNVIENSEGDIDLSDKIETTQGDCPSSGDCFSALDISNNNQGSIDNNLLISALSGNNEAVSQNGNATISTGDANVSVSIFNLLNTNIVGSNWYNLIINIFADWTGDLVLPGKKKMGEFTNPFGSSGVTVSNTDVGQIENNVSLTSDTGGNSAFGDTASIATGDADSKANIFNIANISSTGNWFFIAVNNFGSWEGQVFSLPPGFKMADDSGDIKIYNINSDDIGEKDSSGTGTDAGVQSGDPEGDNAVVVKNNNLGAIKNSVVINVSTGGNSAVGADGASIKTGNANALASIFNILNSNITGGNWLTGVVNIFGKWKGNLAFGRPDLWVGSSVVDSPSPAVSGDTINYTLTYANKGDADATGVKLKSDFDERYFSVVSPGGGVAGSAPGELQWNIGTVPIGGTGSVSYSLIVSPEIPYGLTSLANQSAIESLETDSNSEDNVDEISVEVYKRPFIWMPPMPNLQITKTRSEEGPVYSGDSVNYEITIVNESDGPALDVSVNDALFNESGEEVSSSNWKLGKVFPREKVFIDYTLDIGSDIPPGLYTSITQAVGTDNSGISPAFPKFFTILEVKQRETGEEISVSEEEATPEIISVPLELAPEIPPIVSSEEIAVEAPFIPQETEKLQEAGKKTKETADKKELVSGSPEKMLEDSIKGILGADAKAAEDKVKEETNISENDGSDGGKGSVESSNGFLASNYKNILTASAFLTLVLVGLYTLSRRLRGE